jgi:hypothetical protein
VDQKSSDWSDPKRSGDFAGCLAVTKWDPPHRTRAARSDDDRQQAADRAALRALSDIIDSGWLMGWYASQLDYPQFVARAVLDRFRSYRDEAQKPERRFHDVQLEALHESFVRALDDFRIGVARVVTPSSNPEHLVIRTKAQGEQQFIADYDAKYDRDIRVIEGCARAVKDSWEPYIREATLRLTA